MTQTEHLGEAFAAPFRRQRVRDIIEWARRNVTLDRGQDFDPKESPWILEPLRCAFTGLVRVVTFVKPVQLGGSALGEILLCYWLAREFGDVQYNWEDDEKARDRWDKRVSKILRACAEIVWPSNRHLDQKGLVIFDRGNLTMQGVHAGSNLDSDSIRYQINEEIHNWAPGRLSMAYDRTSKFADDATIVNISNAGVKDDQLHAEFLDGTQEHWEVPCPGCKQFHAMRTRWEDKRPEWGGLRYDSEQSKRKDGTHNYSRLAATLRYQMPCGYIIPHGDRRTRRAMSDGGRYGAPANADAVNHRSFTLAAVAAHSRDWLELVKKKHKALAALRTGDPEPWFRYQQRDECVFYDRNDRPIAHQVVLNRSVVKNRTGLREHKDFAARFAAIDRQSGSLAKGEQPHYWMAIRDFLKNGDSQLVYEGKVHTDDDVIAVLDRHEVDRFRSVADCTWDTRHMYQVCLRFGINGTTAVDSTGFTHPDGGGRKIFSPAALLWQRVNLPGPSQADSQIEPFVWNHSKIGLLDRLHWVRTSKALKWDVPSDVSDDYQSQLESWEPIEYVKSRTKETVPGWQQTRPRDDLHWCERAILMLAEIAGLIGAGPG